MTVTAVVLLVRGAGAKTIAGPEALPTEALDLSFHAISMEKGFDPGGPVQLRGNGPVWLQVTLGAEVRRAFSQ